MGNHGGIHVVEVRAANDGADDGGAAPMCELSGQRTDRAQHPMHQYRLACDRPVAEHGPVCGDAWNAKARAYLVGDFVGERNGLALRHAGQLRGGAKRPVGLRAVGPHPLPDPAAVHSVADGVDHAGAVAVRDDPRKAHRSSLPAGALLGVAGIEAGEADSNPDLTRAGLGIRQLSHLQDICRRTLPVIPGRQHVSHLREALRRRRYIPWNHISRVAPSLRRSNAPRRRGWPSATSPGWRRAAEEIARAPPIRSESAILPQTPWWPWPRRVFQPR